MSNDLINYEKYHAGRKPKQRRIMRTFKLSEISVVDRPAQAGARMTIMHDQHRTMGVLCTRRAHGSEQEPGDE